MKKTLAFLLTLCLLTALVPINTLAEDAEILSETFEAPISEIQGELDANGLMADSEETVSGAEEAPELPLSEAMALSLVDHPDFLSGYAAVLDGENAVYDDDYQLICENLPVDAVIYVTGRSADGRAAVTFGLADITEAVRGWMDDRCLRPLTAGETALYYEVYVLHYESALYVDEERTLPLPVVTFSAPQLSDAPQAAAEPDDVRFNVDALTLGVGESAQGLHVIFGTLPDVEYDTSAVYTSSKPKYVSVDAEGNVRGVKKGTAVVTVTTANGLSASCKVTVKKAPRKVVVSPATLKLGVGDRAKLSYKLSSSSSAGSVRWSSDNIAVATVDALTGEVTGVGSGTAEITALTYNGKHSSATVTVYEAPSYLALEPSSVTIGQGQKVKLSPVINEGAYTTFTFTSSDSDVAMFTNGTVTGVSAGTAVVTVESGNGLRASCQVTVLPAPTKVSLPFTTLRLGAGDSFQLVPETDGSPESLSYSSNRTKYAKVSSTGLISAVKAGTAYVTVSTYNGKSFKLKVIVQKAPTGITVSPRQRILGVGEGFALKASISGGAVGTIAYESSDPSVVSVDEEGRVTALAPGEASVTARTYNGKTDFCTVTVYAAPTGIELENSIFEISAGQTEKLKATLTDGSWSNLSYESDDPDVVSVSDDGTITGRSGGKANITVSTHVPGVYATAVVTVWEAPSEVTLKDKTQTVNVGDIINLDPVIPEGSRTSFTYTCSAPKVATVTEDGVVTAIGRGMATITVATHNGKKATLALTVYDPQWPEEIKLLENPSEMKVGQTWQTRFEMLPSTAPADLMWSSSDETVATVDQTGLVKAVGYGYANITAVSLVNEECELAFTVSVETDALTLVIPARTTGVDGIAANLAKIDAIRASAISEITRLYKNKTISSADADRRREIVNTIFEHYAFPWKTPALQKYWKAKNSENGVKDFKPDRVYYGMPYISGTGTNRNYTPQQALKENRYYDTGEGYYMLNQDKLLNGKYVGNDCSGLVSVVIWGLNSSHTKDRTDDIAGTPDYRTISDYSAMRPGDLLCKGDAHVVMFLYYANASKTKIMMIENGGAEAGTNTVHCDVYDLSYYVSRGYKVRRLSTLGK